MRTRLALAVVAGVVGAMAVGCSSGISPSESTISITPAGPVAAAAGGATTTFTAITSNPATVSWVLSPAVGTLTAAAGPTVGYTPPATAATATAVKLTATVAGGPSASVTINVGPVPFTAQQIPGLSAPVTVTYDARDIPNINCTSRNDCFAVQGYIHARDRLFEMDLFRRLARGELAELIGDTQLGSDIQFRTLFTTRDGQPLAEALLTTLDDDTRASLEAYAAGASAYIAQMKAGDAAAPFPAEYGMLLYPVTPAVVRDWTVADTLAVARLFQFELSETLSKELDVGQFYATYGPGAPLEDLAKVNAWIRCQQPVSAFTLSAALAGGGGRSAAAAAKAPAQRMPHLQNAVPGLHELSERLGRLPKAFADLRERAGSNNWVVSGTSSATGKAMVANDPHLQFQYPPLFHLATLTGDGLQVLGGAFPGVPGALIGRGPHVGWGVTVVGYDVTDVYLESIDPATGKIHFGAGEVSLIAVPQTVSYRTSVGVSTTDIVVLVSPPHGPIIGQVSALQPISMRWTGLELTNDVKAFLGLLLAPDVDAAMLALKDYATGAQNFVLADDQGNIGYDPHALVPLRPWAGTVGPVSHAALLPWAPLPGIGEAEWGDGAGNTWVPDDQLPQGKNPAKGYFATANSAPDSIYCVDNDPLPAGQPYLSFDWDDPTGFRAGRIMDRLGNLTSGGGKVALADMQSIQTDHVMTLAQTMLPAIDRQPAGDANIDAAKAMLDQWSTDGLNCPTGLVGTDPVSAVNDPDAINTHSSAACMLFHTFLNHLLVSVFAEPLALAGQGIDNGNAIRGILYLLTPNLPAPAQTFCAPLTCDEQVGAALSAAYGALTVALGDPVNWRWGRLHTMSPKSAAFPLVAGFYNPGPYARPGGALTVDVGNPSLRTDNVLSFQYGAGSNVRYLAAMDGTVTKMQLPGPIVDGPLYPGNPGLLGQYVVNQYFDFPYGAAAIAAATVRTQSFTAP